MNPILANTGIPMICIHMPINIIALIPVIIIEVFIATKIFDISKKKLIKSISFANVISTIIGLPILWILCVIIQISIGGGRAYGLDSIWKIIYAVTIQSPWLIPYESDLNWLIKIAVIPFMVPAFFMSIIVEGLYLKSMLKIEDSKLLHKFLFKSHFYSYSFLLVVYFIILKF